MIITTTEARPWVVSSDPVSRVPGDSCPPAADLEITDQATIRWRGFGVCFNELGWLALGHLAEEERSSCLDDLFLPGRSLGVEFCRLPIGANDYAEDWYRHNETTGDFRMEHFSIDRALLSVYSPGRPPPDLSPSLGRQRGGLSWRAVHDRGRAQSVATGSPAASGLHGAKICR